MKTEGLRDITSRKKQGINYDAPTDERLVSKGRLTVLPAS
jgi:hypothetical protein